MHADKPGQPDKQTLELQFRRLDASEREAFIARIGAEKLSDRAVCESVVLAARKVAGADGKELPSDPALLQRLWSVPGLCGATVTAFFESWAPAAEKN
ncbi:MAG: hypothetical protein ACRC2H_08380 [Silanimonas sp.]